MAVLRFCLCVLAWNLWSARRFHEEARKRVLRALAWPRSNRDQVTPRRKRLFVVLADSGRCGGFRLARRHCLPRKHHVLLRPQPNCGRPSAGHKRFRVGGMVVKGSVSRKPGDLAVRFVLTDFAHEVPVDIPACCPICSVKVRASLLTGPWVPTAPSWRMKCLRSTMRSICRQKSPPR